MSTKSARECDACTLGNTNGETRLCIMCVISLLHPKKAALSAAAPICPLKRDKKKAALAAAAPICPLKRDKPPTPLALFDLKPKHPSGLVLDIVGTARTDRGRNCEEHNCCGEVLGNEVLVCLRRVQILVPDEMARAHKPGAMKEVTAYTVNWVTDGQDRCRVGFLPRSYVAQGTLYNGVLCQVVSVGSYKLDNRNERAKCHHNCGFARAQVISPLNHEVDISPACKEAKK